MPADAKPTPTVVIFVTKDGVREVQLHTPARWAEREGAALFDRISKTVDRLDRAARGDTP